MPIVESSKLDRMGLPALRSLHQISPQVKRVLELASHLPQADRMMVELVMRANLSLRKVGELLDVDPGTVSRRYARVVRRMVDPLVGLLADDHCELPPAYRAVGIDRLLGQLPISHIAQRHGLMNQEVREILGYLRGWHRGKRGK